MSCFKCLGLQSWRSERKQSSAIILAQFFIQNFVEALGRYLVGKPVMDAGVQQRCELLERARVGTHGIRHRSTADIANSGIPVKVGMALTAHKTVAMFMRYVRTEDDTVREAAELVASRRKSVVSMREELEKCTRSGYSLGRTR